MPLAPVTEEDKPIVERAIQKMVSLRRRETANGRTVTLTDYLSDAIINQLN